MRTYTELLRIPLYEDRFEYLKLDGIVAEDTFGFDRWLNQHFYHSSEWKRVRDQVIVRDKGCDLASQGHEIGGLIVIHHMNPIRLEDLIHGNLDVINPEYLVCVSRRTHNAIHYGDRSLLPPPLIQRSRFDTCPWLS